MDIISEAPPRRFDVGVDVLPLLGKPSFEPKGRERLTSFLSNLSRIPKEDLVRHLVMLGLVATTIFLSPHQAKVSPIKPQSASAAVSQETLRSVPQIEQLASRISTEPLISKEVAKELARFQNDQERITKTLGWKNMLELIVADPRLAIAEKDREFWTSRILQIIFVESGGNPNASSDIAFGLTQLTDSTAKDAAKKLGVSKYDIYNSWDNSILGIIHLQGLIKRYGLDLGFWTYHLGSGNMDTALKTYLIQEKKWLVAWVDGIFEDANSDKALSDIIKGYQITTNDLLGSTAVIGKLKQIGAFGDETDRYTIRLIAAGIAMNPG